MVIKSDRDIYMEAKAMEGKQDRLNSYADSLNQVNKIEKEKKPLKERLPNSTVKSLEEMGKNAKKILTGG